MVLRIRLQNITSFGAMQTASLEAITVIVGANNSGKTNFMRAAELVRDGGASIPRFRRRPSTGDGMMIFEWEMTLEGTGAAARTARWSFRLDSHGHPYETIVVD